MSERTRVKLDEMERTALADGWCLYQEPGCGVRVGYVGREVQDVGTVLYHVLEILGAFYLSQPLTRTGSMKREDVTEKMTADVRTRPPAEILAAVDRIWNGEDEAGASTGGEG